MRGVGWAGGVQKDAAGWRTRSLKCLEKPSGWKKETGSVDLFISDSDRAY